MTPSEVASPSHSQMPVPSKAMASAIAISLPKRQGAPDRTRRVCGPPLVDLLDGLRGNSGIKHFGAHR